MEKQNLVDMHYAQPSDSNQSVEDSNKSCILLDDDSNSMERQHESSENVGISKDTELVTTYDTKYSWIVLAGAVMSYFFIFGCSVGFTLYQNYNLLTKFPTEKKSLVLWINSLASAVTMCFGIVASPLVLSYISIRKTIILGGIVSSLGLFLASMINSKVWHLLLFQSVLYGMGSSLVVNTSLLGINLWFYKYRSMAIHLVSSASSLGGIALTPIVQVTLDKLGYNWSLRVIAILNLLVVSICGFVIKSQTEYRPKSLNLKLTFTYLKDPRLILVLLYEFVYELGFAVPAVQFGLYLIVDLADHANGTASNFASYILMILSLTNFAGRAVTGVLCHRLGPQNIMIFTTLIAAILIFTLWYPVRNLAVNIVFFILFGLCGSTGFSTNLVLLNNILDSSVLPHGIGLLYLSLGVSTLCSGPIMGSILDYADGTDNTPTTVKPLIIFSGVIYLIACMISICIKFYLKPQKGNPLPK